MKFKKIINMAWNASGLKKGAFADVCGVSRHMMSRYIDGKSTPDFNKAVKIIENSGYKVDVSLPLSEKESSQINDEKKDKVMD
jgi:predicted transcriptional regulator